MKNEKSDSLLPSILSYELAQLLEGWQAVDSRSIKIQDVAFGAFL